MRKLKMKEWIKNYKEGSSKSQEFFFENLFPKQVRT
jgi:hypothetical protein